MKLQFALSRLFHSKRRIKTEPKIEELNEAQKRQIKDQLLAHRHERYEVDIKLADDFSLNGFIVYPRVYRPDVMCALHLARYLYAHPEIYEDKRVLDMGCGTGLQGIVIGLRGAKHVYFSDVSDIIDNVRENLEKFGLINKATINVPMTLFGNIAGKAEVIVFNHPFFPASPKIFEPVEVSMLDSGILIHRFLEDAKQHLVEGGVIIMPFFHLAGDTNNPAVQGPKHGYQIEEKSRIENTEGLQKGETSIYVLR